MTEEPAGLSLAPYEEIGLQLAFILYVELTPIFKDVFAAKFVVSRFVYLDVSGGAVGFHVPGRVNGLAPDIIAEFGFADDARDDWAGVNADPQAKGLAVRRIVPDNFLLQAERSFGDGFGVVGPCDGHAGRDHVGIAYSFDFFQAKLLDYCFEAGIYLVEQLDHLSGVHSFG